MNDTTRRGFLLGLGAAVVAPAIVKYANIMPVRNRLILPSYLDGIEPGGHYFAVVHPSVATDLRKLALSKGIDGVWFYESQALPRSLDAVRWGEIKLEIRAPTR